MELHLSKYRYAHEEYLVYDCNKEPFIIENEEVRLMCSANFGIAVKNMLIGPVMEKGKLSVLVYHTDGTMEEAGEAARYVFNQYLSDAGYINRLKESKAHQVSRIYLYDHFIEDNHIRYLKKKAAI